MDINAVQTRQAHRLLQYGVLLILVAALLGLVIPLFAVPRLGLSAHLLGILQGIFMLVIGLVWPRLNLGNASLSVTFWLLIYGSLAALAADLSAATWGAGNSMLPLAAGSAHGSDLQEGFIHLALRSAGVALIAAFALIFWGLRGVPAEAG